MKINGKQPCLKKTSPRPCSSGTEVGVSCKARGKQLYGPPKVVCMDNGWQVNVQEIECLEFQAISSIRSKTNLTIFLEYNDVPKFTHSTVNLTDRQSVDIGSQHYVRCMTGWSNETSDQKLPRVDIRWFFSDGKPVPVEKQVIKQGKGARLKVDELTEPGNYTFICKVGPWHPWPVLMATVTYQVEKRLCAEVEPPCNTHFKQSITEENRTVNGTVYFWPNTGWMSPHDIGHPIITTCTNTGWEPPINELAAQPTRCNTLTLPKGMSKRFLDGENHDYYGAFYELSCDDKLTAMTGPSFTYCNSSGKWFPKPGTCERVSCGSPPGVINAVCDCPDHSIGAVCSCKCKPGYWFDRSTRKELECSASGWTPSGNDLSSCIQCQCQRKAIPSDWKWTGRPGSGYIRSKRVFCQGSIITVSCKKGNKTIPGTLQCMGNSWKWIKQPECAGKHGQTT